eukprot:gnl/TRDRNA2_/TRDRNA2_47624_c0_seq1.p1 gnl/TRDRNA2_/TRDRNA2_47624_c0~~gnl/TRDRNA2_/TRDRNA2_47624_c0_seq1.p1  ORF type:complete len:327 (-),score=9.93 gnl/TRDRNA2_/TRDRNA2_47624_c0_seq1:23-1003(-)
MHIIVKAKRGWWFVCLLFVCRLQASSGLLLPQISDNDENKAPVLHDLPILTPHASSRAEHPLWHKYFERVYHQEVTAHQVDLNKFTWFYWDAPLNISKDKIKQVHCVLDASENTPPGNIEGHDGMAWIGAPSTAPEEYLSEIGFFVERPKRKGIHLETRVEVMHVGTNINEAGGVKWFYHTIGSGIFLDLDSLRQTHGKVHQLDSLNTNPDTIADEMKTPGALPNQPFALSTLILTRGSACCLSGGPRTEIIVREEPANDSSSASWLSDPKGSCPRLPFSSGYNDNERLPCLCDSESKFLNCGSRSASFCREPPPADRTRHDDHDD